MGSKLVQYFEFAKQKGGMLLQVKLALKTGIAQPTAAREQDSLANMNLFYKALKELLHDDPSIPRPN